MVTIAEGLLAKRPKGQGAAVEIRLAGGQVLMDLVDGLEQIEDVRTLTRAMQRQA